MPCNQDSLFSTPMNGALNPHTPFDDPLLLQSGSLTIDMEDDSEDEAPSKDPEATESAATPEAPKVLS